MKIVTVSIQPLPEVIKEWGWSIPIDARKRQAGDHSLEEEQGDRDSLSHASVILAEAARKFFKRVLSLEMSSEMRFFASSVRLSRISLSSRR